MMINYTTEPIAGYNKAISGAKTLEELFEAVGMYKRIAGDALEVVGKMNGRDFLEFQKGLRDERKGNFAGEAFTEKYGAILMPHVMVEVGMLAHYCKAPWGCAFIRMKEMGKIKETRGIARIVPDESPSLPGEKP